MDRVGVPGRCGVLGAGCPAPAQCLRAPGPTCRAQGCRAQAWDQPGSPAARSPDLRAAPRSPHPRLPWPPKAVSNTAPPAERCGRQAEPGVGRPADPGRRYDTPRRRAGPVTTRPPDPGAHVQLDKDRSTGLEVSGGPAGSTIVRIGHRRRPLSTGDARLTLSTPTLTRALPEPDRDPDPHPEQAPYLRFRGRR